MKKLILLLTLILFIACSNDNVQQQTEFVAYTMAQFTRFDLSGKDDKYNEWLETTFGATSSQVENVIEYAKEVKTMSKLESDVNYLIFKNINKLQDDNNKENIDEFMVNILTPYLWRYRNENPVSTSAEEKINAKYVEYFGLTNGANGLKSLLNSFNEYQNGGYFSNDSLNMVNNAIKKFGFYLKFDPESKYVCLFDIDDVLFKSNPSSKFEFTAFKLKRRIPCTLPLEYGYSSIGANDVVVLMDRIENKSDEVDKHLNDESLLYYSDGRYENIWRSSGINLDLTKANKIFSVLSHLDFGKKSKDQITKDLLLETALHEAKHKYDEMQNYEMRINWDSEISAHLTEIIYSNTPYHSLMDGIQRIEGFASVSMDSKICDILRQLWGVAQSAEAPSYTKDNLRKDVFNIYSQYLTYNEKNLTNLADFEKEIIPMIWSNVYKK
jgi:hypothetical protein